MTGTKTTSAASGRTAKMMCIGTGHGAVPENAVFLGTVLDDPYVWHFYYRKES